MKKGLVLMFAVAMAAFVGAAVSVGMRVAFGDWTYGTIERLLTDPERAEGAIGYRPPDLLALQRMLLDGRFDELDARFVGLQRDYLAGERPEREYVLAYAAFDTTNPAVGTALDRWVAQRPGSAAALVARAGYRMYVGWWMGGYARPARSPMERGKDWRPDAPIYAEATEDLERAVSIDPQNTVAFAKLISVANRTSEPAMARGALERGLAVDPLSYAVHASWVALLQNGPEGVKGAQEYADAIRPEMARKPLLKRLDAQILAHRAATLADDGEPHAAIDLLFQAGAIAESGDILHQRARLLRETGATDWAEADLERASAYLPQMVRTLAARADLYRATGRTELAAREFARALELDPFNPSMLWTLASNDYDAGLPRDAEAKLTTAMRLIPDDPHFRYRRGQLRLTKLDDPAGAADDLAVVAKAYPDSPEVWRLYMRALTDTDDCRAVDALAEYRRACAASDDCRGSQIKAETRRVERMAERLACAPSS